MCENYLRFPNFVANACCNPCCEVSVEAQRVDSLASDNCRNLCSIPVIPCNFCGCGNVGGIAGNNCGNVGGIAGNNCGNVGGVGDGCGCGNVAGVDDGCGNVGGIVDSGCGCHHHRRRRRYR